MRLPDGLHYTQRSQQWFNEAFTLLKTVLVQLIQLTNVSTDSVTKWRDLTSSDNYNQRRGGSPTAMTLPQGNVTKIGSPQLSTSQRVNSHQGVEKAVGTKLNRALFATPPQSIFIDIIKQGPDCAPSLHSFTTLRQGVQGVLSTCHIGILWDTLEVWVLQIPPHPHHRCSVLETIARNDKAGDLRLRMTKCNLYAVGKARAADGGERERERGEGRDRMFSGELQSSLCPRFATTGNMSKS
ncbi:hypothetical protein TcWFU_004149 [Taenia crassiceps]|uniref:Uncharacterized protein n=1 Tax=Taenia crassiceps TaxID=6207 RepID=A0ABR4Q6G4_9CEST